MICEGTLTYGWVCGWLSGCVGQCVGSGQITNYQINLDLIGIIQFYLKINFFVETPSYRWVCGWLDGWVCRCVGYVKSLKI